VRRPLRLKALQDRREVPGRDAPLEHEETSMMSKEQIAHDLAMAYINNRYGPEVSGNFSVDTWNDEVSGSGSVNTQRLPDVHAIRMVEVPTGEKYFFGLSEKKESVESGYAVDGPFESMIKDYFNAYSRFLELLGHRQPSTDTGDECQQPTVDSQNSADQ
jgi:hypothetical protein